MEKFANYRAVFVMSLLTAAAPATRCGFAQTPTLNVPAATASSTTPTLTVDAHLVDIPAVVFDKKGALVQNLTKDSFVLTVDNKPREIHYFSLDKDLPLSLGLLVDTSQSQRDVLDDERLGSSAFLDDMLIGPAGRDKAFVIQFARQVDLLQDTTASKPLLQAGLKQLGSGEPDQQARSGGSVTDPRDSNNGSGSNNGGNGRAGRGGGTALYDAVYLASDELMSKQSGRKALIILSDGVDRGSKESIGSAIEAAQRANTVVYAIYYKGREADRGFGDRENRGGGNQGGRGGGIGFPGGGGGYPGGGGGYPSGGGGQQRRPQNTEQDVDGKKMLNRIASETGGRLFEMNKKDSLAGIYKEIGDELRAQYRLGYTPDKETASEGYHRIVLTFSKTAAKDLYAQTRDGYYGKE